jgi:3-deoxy-D-manno-octulosonate 8-phosphate phosphatase (KDO 8-P phosphatase)
MKNQSASDFSKSEHLIWIFLNSKNKKEAFESICINNKISPKEIAYVFDDVLDIEVAKLSGLSFFVGRRSNPLLVKYIKQNKICDYITAFSGENHAVREICELLLGLSGNYNRTLELRVKYKGEYEEYLNKRTSINTNIVLFR